MAKQGQSGSSGNVSDYAVGYRVCFGEVVGPVDAQQAEPFVTLVREYRVWQARLEQLQMMAGQATGHMQSSYPNPISAVVELLAAIRHHLPASFQAQLDWDDQAVPEGSLDIEDLHNGDTVYFGLLPPESDEMAYALYVLVGAAMSALSQVRRQTRLDIAANTEILINRLRTERANRDDGAPLPYTAPEFGDYYEGLVAEPDGNTEAPAQ